MPFLDAASIKPELRDGGFLGAEEVEGEKAVSGEPSFMRDVVLKTAKDFGGHFLGSVEVAANLATQAYGLPLRGYGEVAQVLTGRTGIADRISKATIYEPYTSYGAEQMDAIGKAFEWWHEKSMAAGEPVAEAVAPILGERAAAFAGAAVATGVEAAPVFAGPSYARGKEFVRVKAGTIKESIAKAKELTKAVDEAPDLYRPETYGGTERRTTTRISNAAIDEMYKAERAAGEKTGKFLSAEEVKVETPSPEKGLFPEEKTSFALVSEEAPEPMGAFRPAPAEQPLLAGTEKAYRDVGMGEKPTVFPEGVKSQVSDLVMAMDSWEKPGRTIVDPKGNVTGRIPSTYPPWFKMEFPNDTANTVSIAARKWLSGDALTKKETKITSKLQDIAANAEEGGFNVAEEGWRYLLKDVGGDVLMVNRAARQLKEFWSPFSTVPQGKEYLALRYKDLLGGLTRVDRIVGILNKRYANLPLDVKKDVFNAIRGEIPMDTLPEEVRTIAGQTRGDLDRVGQMLVRRGLLKKEVFEANKDTYIHYLYLRHLLPDDAQIPVGRGGRMDLSYLKARKDLPEQVRKELGLIEDVSVAAPVGMGKALGDVVKSDFFAKVAENPEWVWQPSKEIAKLSREYDAYRQIVERGENVGPEVVSRLKTLETELATKTAEAGKVPEDFVKLPDSKSYGDLAGTLVRKEIANDIIPVYSINPAELEGLAKLWNKTGTTFDTGMTLFKVGKVALNLPTAIRNAFSNLLQMNMSGIPFYRIPGVVIEGTKSMLSKDQLFRTFQDNGGFKTNFSVAELGEVLKAFQKAKGGSADKVFGAIYDAAKYYGKIDDIAKMSLFKDAVNRQGMAVTDAVIYAQKWGMDYSLASRSVKHARRFVLPFASYQYKIAPLIAESLVKRPWVIAKFAAIPYVLSKLAAYKYDWSEKDLDKAARLMAEKTKGQGAYTLLPIKDNKGNIEIVNLEYFLPWGNWLEAARAVKGGEYVDAAKQFGGIAGPYGNLFTMINTKRLGEPPKDPFTGQPIYSKLDSPQDKYLKQVQWYWQLFGPSSFSSNGALGYTARAMTGAKDKWGTEATGGKALLRWMGANVGSLDEQSILVARKARLRQLELEIARIMRDPKYGKEDRKNAIKQLQIERRKILSPE